MAYIEEFSGCCAVQIVCGLDAPGGIPVWIKGDPSTFAITASRQRKAVTKLTKLDYRPIDTLLSRDGKRILTLWRNGPVVKKVVKKAPAKPHTFQCACTVGLGCANEVPKQGDVCARCFAHAFPKPTKKTPAKKVVARVGRKPQSRAWA